MTGVFVTIEAWRMINSGAKRYKNVIIMITTGFLGMADPVISKINSLIGILQVKV
jgi:hypothetical protein